MLRVGEVAEQLGCSVSSVLRYEKKGLIKSYRLPGGHRRYAQEDVDSLRSQPSSVVGGSLPAEGEL